MQTEKILNESIEEIIERNYGTVPDLKELAVFVSDKEKIWITTKEAFALKNELYINSIGLYIGKLKRNDKIHLSLEGMQFFVKDAKKNIVVVDDDTMKKFMQGSDIRTFKKVNCEIDNFVLVKYGEDFIGTGILKEDKVENLLPKSKRIY